MQLHHLIVVTATVAHGHDPRIHALAQKLSDNAKYIDSASSPRAIAWRLLWVVGGAAVVGWVLFVVHTLHFWGESLAGWLGVLGMLLMALLTTLMKAVLLVPSYTLQVGCGFKPWNEHWIECTHDGNGNWQGLFFVWSRAAVSGLVWGQGSACITHSQACCSDRWHCIGVLTIR